MGCLLPSSLRGQSSKDSSLFNAIFLASGDGARSGDDGDLVHNRTKLVLFGLYYAGGRPPGCVFVVRRKGARTKRSGRRLWRRGFALDLRGDQLPHPPSHRPRLCILPGLYLSGESVRSRLLGTLSISPLRRCLHGRNLDPMHASWFPRKCYRVASANCSKVSNFV